MFVINKASGGLGKAIPHPLQSKVDRVLYLNLGDKKDWVIGSTVRFDRFDHIRNRLYVNNRLESLGFTPDSDNTYYEFTGTSGCSSKQDKSNVRIKSKLEIASVKLKQSDIKLRVIEKILLSGKPVNSSEITVKDKRKLGVIISTLKNTEGVRIEVMRVKDSTVDFTIYALESVYKKLTDNAFKCTAKNIAAYLEDHGEVSASEIGVSSKKLSEAVHQLRASGYEIKTLGLGQRKPSTYKLISKP